MGPLRGLLEKKTASGTWRARAFELTEQCLAYEEVRQGKRVRASVAVACLGSVHVHGGELFVTEVGGCYTHVMRPAAAGPGSMPTLEEWRTALSAAVDARPLSADYGVATCRRSRAPLRVRGALLKKGGSRQSVAGIKQAGRRLSFGTRRNWSRRDFFLNFARAELEYRDEGGALKGTVKLTPASEVRKPGAVSMRGTHAAALADDAEPLYFEVSDTVDEAGAPRDFFAIRALAKRDFAEWILSLKECVAALRSPEHLAESFAPPVREDFDSPSDDEEEYEMAHPLRLASDPPPKERVSSFAGDPPSLRASAATTPGDGNGGGGDDVAALAAAVEALGAPAPPPPPEDETPEFEIPPEILECFIYFQDAQGDQQGPATFGEFKRAFDAQDTHRGCLVFAHGVVDEWKTIEDTVFRDLLLAPATARPPPPAESDSGVL